jgi:hypothetical protein
MTVGVGALHFVPRTMPDHRHMVSVEWPLHLQSKFFFEEITVGHVRLNLSARLISHGAMFFSHNKTASASLSATKTISQTARIITDADRTENGS